MARFTLWFLVASGIALFVHVGQGTHGAVAGFSYWDLPAFFLMGWVTRNWKTSVALPRLDMPLPLLMRRAAPARGKGERVTVATVEASPMSQRMQREIVMVRDLQTSEIAKTSTPRRTLAAKPIESASSAVDPTARETVIRTLQGMGFTGSQAKSAVQKVSGYDSKPMALLIKESLTCLSK